MSLNRRQPGTRVIAVMNATETEVFSFGSGVYDGDFPCPHFDGFDNPRITLDTGKVVWGCQCWWGSEEYMQQKFIGGREVVLVEPDGDGDA